MKEFIEDSSCCQAQPQLQFKIISFNLYNHNCHTPVQLQLLGGDFTYIVAPLRAGQQPIGGLDSSPSVVCIVAHTWTRSGLYNICGLDRSPSLGWIVGSSPSVGQYPICGLDSSPFVGWIVAYLWPLQQLICGLDSSPSVACIVDILWAGQWSICGLHSNQSVGWATC